MRKILLTISIAMLIACGGETKKETQKSEPVKKEVVEKEVIEVKVTAMGESMSEIKFDPANLSIPANSKVILTLENKSSAEGMLHNFVLVELGSGAEISSAGITAGKEKGFVPNDNRVIAYTAVSNMGESVSVEFDAPAKGSYHYICTYPGHTSMIGRLNVE